MSITTHSDYRTASEFIDAFESDNEPPQDKLFEERLIQKLPDMYIFKKIIKLGNSRLDNPSKLDIVNYKIKEIQNYESALLADIEKKSVKEKQLGFSKKYFNNNDLIYLLQSMKREEISLFKIEYFDYDCYKKRTLRVTKYYMLQLINWIEIVDIYNDSKIRKIILNKGEGIKRANSTAILKIKILFFNENEEYEYYNEETILNNQKDIFLDFFPMIESLKPLEKSIFYINKFELKDFPIINKIIDQLSIPLVNFKKNINGIEYYFDFDKYVYFSIYIEDIKEQYDIFNDNCALMICEKKGISSAAPNEYSKIYFNYQIAINNDIIYESSKLKEENYKESEKYFTNINFNYVYLNDYKYSKLLNRVLKLNKKREVSIIKIDYNGYIKYIKYGEDFDIINNYCENNNIKINNIEYKVVTYYFNESSNISRINNKDKEAFIIYKTKISKDLLMKGNYNKAIKVLDLIISSCNQSRFDEDKNLFIEYEKNSLSNKSLCYWKLSKYNYLKDICLKLILDFNIKSEKILFRLCIAYLNLKEYEKGIELIKKYNLNNKKDFINIYNNLVTEYKNFITKEKNIYKNIFKNN